MGCKILKRVTSTVWAMLHNRPNSVCYMSITKDRCVVEMQPFAKF